LDTLNDNDNTGSRKLKSDVSDDTSTSVLRERSETVQRITVQSSHVVSDGQKIVDAKADGNPKKKKTKKKYNTWWIKAAVISFVLAAFFSFLSELTASAEQIVVIVLLLAFLILASILFDAIGVAVTSCDATPIISMASRKVYGARTAMWLVKNSGTVSSICNDVIGDIFGIISGACSAAVVVKIALTLGEEWQRWLTIIISAVVSALTIGGKAFMKNIAINNSKDFVMFVARLVAVFNKDERKIRKKENAQKKQNKSDGKARVKQSDKPKDDDRA